MATSPVPMDAPSTMKRRSRSRQNSPPPRPYNSNSPPPSPSPGGIMKNESSPRRRRRVRMSPPRDSSTKHDISGQGDSTDTTMEDSANRLDDTAEPQSPILISSMIQEAEIPVVEITVFHECIQAKDWDQLGKALKKVDPRYYKRKREQTSRRKELTLLNGQHPQMDDNASSSSPKSEAVSIKNTISTPSPRRGARMLKFLPQSLNTRHLDGKEQESIISPLLKVDDQGRTPLHLALLNECPETILLELLQSEKMAASQTDNDGQVPLHLAVKSHQHAHILEKIIKAHPNALKTKDIQSRTPVGYAVERARQEQEQVKMAEDPNRPYHWGMPLSDDQKVWQIEQIKFWETVDFLLKDLMRRKKCVIPSEHGLLLEALEAGAPPKSINRFVSTTHKHLSGDDDLSGSALTLCVERQYSLDTMEYLLDHCRERTTMITDYAHKSLVSHYRIGCHPMMPGMSTFGKEIIDWCKANTAKDQEKEDGGTKKVQFLLGTTKQCQEWWNTLRYLLFYAAYGKDFWNKAGKIDDMFMVHAALAVPSVQPSMIHLLLVAFPESRTELCPTYKAPPVHLACTRWRYDIMRSDKDSSLEKVMKMVLKADKEQVVRRHRGRLPIHMALSVGQSWSFIRPFISIDKKMLGMRDPYTKLFPFQLAAMKHSSKNLGMLLRNRYTPSEWRNISQTEKKAEFTKAEDFQNRRQAGTIYELLRRYPNAILGKYIVRESVKVASPMKEVGLVSSHFLSWAYYQTPSGWKLNALNVKPLRDSIVNGYIAKSLVPWWERMRECIWEATHSDSIPQTDEYLLHAALYNPDMPPLIIELLLELYPMAATRPIPGTSVYPLHIAAGTIPYHPQPFEIISAADNMHLVLNAYKGAARLTVNGRLPLHICLARGKTWKLVRPLVQQDRKALLIQDPISGLVPFQLMAIFKISSMENGLRFASMAEKHTRNFGIDDLSVVDRAKVLAAIQRNHDLDVLSTVYALLRQKAGAVSSTLPGYATESPSIVSSVTLEDFPRISNVDRVSAALEQFLNDIKQTPVQDGSRTHGGLKQKTLSSFLQQERGIPNLLTPSQGRRSHVGDGNPSYSQRSLISRSSAATPESYSKPVYDDDLMSCMGGSAASSIFSASPANGLNDDRYNSLSSGSSSGKLYSRSPRGRMDRSRFPKLPNLGMDE